VSTCGQSRHGFDDCGELLGGDGGGMELEVGYSQLGVEIVGE